MEPGWLCLSTWVAMLRLRNKDTAVKFECVQARTICASRAAVHGYFLVLLRMPTVPAW